MEAYLDCSGRGKIQVVIPMTGQRVEMSLAIRGTMVVEFVKIVNVPPFFSGVRVFFPNVPDLYFQDFDRPSWLNLAMVFGKGTSLDQMLLGLIRDAITNNAVLPQRFTSVLLGDLDLVYLKSPRPRGVLRLSILRPEAKGKSDEDDRSVIGLSVGSETKSQPLAEGDTVSHDFVLSEWGEGQRLTVSFSPQPKVPAVCTGRILICDLINGSESDADGRFTVTMKPTYDCAALKEAAKVKTLQVKAEWRPFATSSAQLREAFEQPASCRWNLSSYRDVSWGIFADVYHVEGLPGPPAVKSGLLHWAEVTVSKGSGAFVGSSQTLTPECEQLPARTFQESGMENLGDTLSNAGGKHFLRHLKNLPSEDWRCFVIRDPGKSDDGVDKSDRSLHVIWNSTCSALFDTNGSPVESICNARVTVTLWRQHPTNKTGKVEVGQATCALTHIVPMAADYRRAGDLKDAYEWDRILFLPLSGDGQRRGVIKVGLSARLLRPPPEIPEDRHSIARKSIGWDKVSSLVRRQTAIFRSKLAFKATLSSKSLEPPPSIDERTETSDAAPENETLISKFKSSAASTRFRVLANVKDWFTREKTAELVEPSKPTVEFAEKEEESPPAKSWTSWFRREKPPEPRKSETNDQEIRDVLHRAVIAQLEKKARKRVNIAPEGDGSDDDGGEDSKGLTSSSINYAKGASRLERFQSFAESHADRVQGRLSKSSDDDGEDDTCKGFGSRGLDRFHSFAEPHDHHGNREEDVVLTRPRSQTAPVAEHLEHGDRDEVPQELRLADQDRRVDVCIHDMTELDSEQISLRTEGTDDTLCKALAEDTIPEEAIDRQVPSIAIQNFSSRPNTVPSISIPSFSVSDTAPVAEGAPSGSDAVAPFPEGAPSGSDAVAAVVISRSGEQNSSVDKVVAKTVREEGQRVSLEPVEMTEAPPPQLSRASSWNSVAEASGAADGDVAEEHVDGDANEVVKVSASSSLGVGEKTRAASSDSAMKLLLAPSVGGVSQGSDSGWEEASLMDEKEPEEDQTAELHSVANELTFETDPQSATGTADFADADVVLDEHDSRHSTVLSAHDKQEQNC
eukprot:TRINITY_DN3917_c0_g2_i5.p1 TRINITY_DN3917_c0_g2~~TRINITY_DN3917_c0_g2_i5.p1  ORF type:complete len:1264 (-),score=213.47 TRINITY_DN3917_c0_g2_i5:91-3318(-)